MRFFTELAQLGKATGQEIQEAMRVASIVGCDSGYVAGTTHEGSALKEELERAAAHLQNGSLHGSGKKKP